jgi:hypothetical protein
MNLLSIVLRPQMGQAGLPQQPSSALTLLPAPALASSASSSSSSSSSQATTGARRRRRVNIPPGWSLQPIDTSGDELTVEVENSVVRVGRVSDTGTVTWHQDFDVVNAAELDLARLGRKAHARGVVDLIGEGPITVF